MRKFSDRLSRKTSVSNRFLCASPAFSHGSRIATLLALIAFIIDIVLFIYAKRQINDVAPDSNTMPGPMFYMALIAIPIVGAASVLSLLNWRNQRFNDASIPTTGYDYPTDHKVDASSNSIPLETTSAAKVMSAYEASKQ